MTDNNVAAYIRIGSQSAGFTLPKEREAFKAYMESEKQETENTGTNDTVIYCRTASSGVDGISNALQLDSLRQYGQSMGYSPIAAYCDWNESGITLDRPYLQKLLADIRAGAVKRVIVKDLSRLARNSYHLHELMRLFREHGVELVSVNDGGAVDLDESLVISDMIAQFAIQGRKRR